MLAFYTRINKDNQLDTGKIEGQLKIMFTMGAFMANSKLGRVRPESRRSESLCKCNEMLGVCVCVRGGKELFKGVERRVQYNRDQWSLQQR